jgi:outer membrane protein OmpA-like peptidoglycan-associated protein
MFSLILSLSLFVGQQSYLYNSENTYFQEAPAFTVKAEAPPHTPKTVISRVSSRPQPEPKPQSKPLRIDVRKIEPPPIQIKPPSPLKFEPEAKVTEKVYFDFDSFKLKPSEKAKLETLPRGLRYEITGYTCDIGPKDYNDRLALKRAESVKGYLGVSGEVRGKGKRCYVDLKDRSKNRRVEIKPLSK